MKFVFFGDSICVGQFITPYKTWAVRIGKQLEEDFPILDILVSNPSINGNTTRMALERMPFDVQSHGIDVILIQFGINDCNYWQTDKGLPRVSPMAFEANLHEIIDRSINFGAKSVILNTNHPINKFIQLESQSLDHNDLNKSYNKIIRKVANHRECHLIDIELRINDCCSDFLTADYLLPDGAHLDIRGHDLYFSIIYPVIKQIVYKYIKA